MAVREREGERKREGKKEAAPAYSRRTHWYGAVCFVLFCCIIVLSCLVLCCVVSCACGCGSVCV